MLILTLGGQYGLLKTRTDIHILHLRTLLAPRYPYIYCTTVQTFTPLCSKLNHFRVTDHLKKSAPNGQNVDPISVGFALLPTIFQLIIACHFEKSAPNDLK